MNPLDYLLATSLGQAQAVLAQDPQAKLLAGGMTLIPVLKHRLAAPSQLVDIACLPELQTLLVQAGQVTLGAGLTHRAVAASPALQQALPGLARLAGGIGDAQVRARGTLGGSIANNDPAADYPAAILALGATIVTNKRKIAADEFFKGYFTTALQSGELITGIGFQLPEKAGYAKFAQRASRYALVGVFVAKFGATVRVALTGAGETGVFRSHTLETALAKDFSVAGLAGASIGSTGLVSDLHGPAGYRAALIPVVAERAVAAA